MHSADAVESILSSWGRRDFSQCTLALADLSIQEQLIQDALDAAYRLAERRHPTDPTTPSTPEPTPRGWTVEVTDGPMTREELRTWLVDFVEALIERGVSTVPVPYRPGKIPDAADWRDQHPCAPAAFGFFLHDLERVGPAEHDVLRADDIPGIASTITQWVTDDSRPGVYVRLSGDSVYLGRGDKIRSELSDLLPVEPSQLVERVSTKPKALRRAKIRGARFDLQVFDASKNVVYSYEQILDGLRMLAPFLEYAFVRQALLDGPYPTDSRFFLGRPSTKLEKATAMLREPWRDHVAGTFVAQVLTSEHIDRLGVTLADPMADYVVEDLGNVRYLLHAADPEPWLVIPPPGPGDAVFDAAQDLLEPLMPIV